jgi:hypothetical protein
VPCPSSGKILTRNKGATGDKPDGVRTKETPIDEQGKKRRKTVELIVEEKR